MLSLTTSSSDLQAQDARIQRRQALHRAESALSIAHAKVKTAAYDARGNVALRDALDSGTDTGLNTAGGADVFEFVIGDEAEVWCSEIAPGVIRLDAVARVGNQSAHLRSLVRERDSFARYTLFINSRSVNLGSASSTGWTHSNRAVTFFYGGYTYPTITARDGFNYKYGATSSNTTMATDSNGHVAEITMPKLGDIQAREAYADSTVTDLLAGVSASSFDISVEFLGNKYEVTARNRSTGKVEKTGAIALPGSGVIYIPGDVKGLKGKLDGRVTLATSGSVTITDSIQYVDADGDTAYKNGLPSTSGKPYEPNPDYDGNSALGVMSAGSATYGFDSPSRIEVNGYFFSGGMFGVPSSSFGVRESLRILGGQTVESGVIGAYANSSGTVSSGYKDRNYTFDTSLANNPPPRFLAVDEPRFGAYRIVRGAGIGSGEADGVPLQNRAVGGVERAKAKVQETVEEVPESVEIPK